METTGLVLLMLLAVVLSSFLGRAWHLPLPLLQMALGAAMAACGLNVVVLDPALFFLLFLPPLLFLDGWRMPKDVLLREAPTILWLALGLVVFTVLGMGWFIHWLIPAMPLAVCFALGAVVSPTDPVAVSAITPQAALPRRLMHILQGEALLNDASGLVCMRFAVAAALTGAFSLPAALANFVWTALGGLGIGVAMTWSLSWLGARAARRDGVDGGARILGSLLMPFGVYGAAEGLGCSGILAAVAAGITMSYTDVWPWRAATRLHRTAVWDTLQLAVNGCIFVLLGEQAPALIAAAPQAVAATGHGHPLWLLAYAAAIMAALAVLRFTWIWASLAVAGWRARRRGEALPASGWPLVAVTTLAGVRGAVTLAGALTLPLALNTGAPFPARELCILLAAGVIVLSLLLATGALPLALRRLTLPPERPRHAAEDRARRNAAQAAMAAIGTARDERVAAGDEAGRCDQAAARIVAVYRARIDRLGASGPGAERRMEDEIERRLRLVGLHAERNELLRAGKRHGLDELSLRRLVREIDLQEARHGA
jgi:CPA1 family monovalent cation:H+ antiporter